MTNEELLSRLESILKQRGMTLYELQKYGICYGVLEEKYNQGL